MTRFFESIVTGLLCLALFCGGAWCFCGWGTLMDFGLVSIASAQDEDDEDEEEDEDEDEEDEDDEDDEDEEEEGERDVFEQNIFNDWVDSEEGQFGDEGVNALMGHATYPLVIARGAEV